MLKKKYLDPKFKLNLPYDEDHLIVPITLGIFMEEFKITSV